MKAPPPAQASTEAQTALAGRASDQSLASERFRFLLSQAERLRLSLLTLGRLLRRMRREKFGFASAEMLEHFLESAAHVMTAIGESLAHNAPLKIDEAWSNEMHTTVEALCETHESAERTFSRRWCAMRGIRWMRSQANCAPQCIWLGT